jgi:hypothetical protein
VFGCWFWDGFAPKPKPVLPVFWLEPNMMMALAIND